MAVLKALAAMAVWTIAMVGIINFVGFDDHFREPLWAIGGAILLIITLIVNVAIFFAVAKEEPFEWFKNGGGEA